MYLKENFPYSYKDNKCVIFFSASSVKDSQQLIDFGINEILVSYHYISKGLKYYEDYLLDTIEERGGIFMTDSGAFSFLGEDVTEEKMVESYWIDYLESYVDFIERNHKKIFCVANLDLDKILGREIVDKWNDKYFKPLEKLTNVVYVAHKDPDNWYGDKSGLRRVEEYARKHKYIGVNQGFRKQALKVYQIAKRHKVRVHGFAWTSLPTLKSYPFFSVDSTSWLSGVRYGSSYRYDGKNFKHYDGKSKYLRKVDKILCKKNGINYEDLLSEERIATNQYNLLGWLGMRKEFVKYGNIKLWNERVGRYLIR